MEHLLKRLVQRHLVPVLLLPVVLSGLACFAVSGLPQAVRSSSRAEEIILVVVTLLGILGSLGTFVCLRVIRRQPPTWRIFDLDAQRGLCSLLWPGWLVSGADF
jgi:hypothetical protein